MSIIIIFPHNVWHKADIHNIHRLQRNAWVSNTQDRRADYNQTLSLQQHVRVRMNKETEKSPTNLLVS